MIGLGYVGLPAGSGVCRRSGFDVTGFDIDIVHKMNAVGEGRVLHRGRPKCRNWPQPVTAGRLTRILRISRELTRLDIINICVPTPLTRTKDPDVSHMARAVEEIRRRLRTGQLIILGSTTYPGTTQELFVPMLEESGLEVGEDFSLAFAPSASTPAISSSPCVTCRRSLVAKRRYAPS